MAISNVQVPTTPVIVVQASGLDDMGSPTDRAVLTIIFCNNSIDACAIDVHALPGSGDSPSNANKIVNRYTINGEDTFIFTTEDKMVLQPGAKIMASADVDGAITATANYIDL